MFASALQGFAVGGGLIIAIGAQNAFVLSQGVRRQHHLTVALVCSVCDAMLIIIGVAGMGTLVASKPGLLSIASWGGAIFLFFYGLRAFWSAYKGGCLKTNGNKLDSLKKTILFTLALTLLNPHVYLDTVILLGSISAQYVGLERTIFGAGAVVASFVWFFALATGGRLLAPLFQRTITWRLLDIIVGLTMWYVAFSLATGTLG